MSGEPYPKAAQLARGTRRAFRARANRAEWERITAAKIGPCRVCVLPASNGHGFPRVQMHHLVHRSQGGDDVPENIVPLCGLHHNLVTRRDTLALSMLCRSLTDAEREYVMGKLGPAALERLYGVGR